VWWWLWLIVALIAVVVEIVGSGLVFAGVAAAAIVAAGVGALLQILGISAPAALAIDAVAFATASTAYLIALRPSVLRLISGQRPAIGSHHSPPILGKRAVVTIPVSGDGGQVRIGQGEFWSARLYRDGPTIPAEARVEVLWVDGLTALVAPAENGSSLTGDHSSSDG
jgi:membrane protein implicated in regulation of membrane protease activity